MKIIIRLQNSGWVIAATFFLFSPLTHSVSSDEAKIRDYLNQRHPSKLRDFWEKLGPGAASVVVDIHRETKKFDAQHRLLQGLGVLGGDISVRYLKEILSEDNGKKPSDDLSRLEALRALQNINRDEAVIFMEKFLIQTASSRLRFGAAQLIAQSDAAPSDQKKWAALKSQAEEIQKTTYPMSSQVLRAVSSSSDRDIAVWLGLWKGHWVTQKKSGGGTDAFPMEISIGGRSSRDISVAIRITGPKGVEARHSAKSKVVGGRLHSDLFRIDEKARVDGAVLQLDPKTGWLIIDLSASEGLWNGWGALRK